MRANGALIRSIRHRRGESIEQVAARAEITAKSLGAIETGARQDPRSLTLRAIARALEVDLAEITSPSTGDTVGVSA